MRAPPRPLSPRSEGASSQQLAQLVEELGKGLRRVLRRHRNLSSALLAAREEVQHHQEQQRQQQSWCDQQPPVAQQPAEQASGHREGGQQEASSSEGASWAIGAAQHGGGGGSSASAAMAEAGRRAASIAEKLDRLLTPQSRAAVHGRHGGGTGAVRYSRFSGRGLDGLGDGCAAAGDEQSHIEAAYGGFDSCDFQTGGFRCELPTDPADEVPLRRRFGVATEL